MEAAGFEVIGGAPTVVWVKSHIQVDRENQYNAFHFMRTRRYGCVGIQHNLPFFSFKMEYSPLIKKLAQQIDTKCNM